MDERPTRAAVAAFDFDHTLTTHDSVIPFLIVAVGKRGLVRHMARDPLGVAAGILRRDRDRLRAIATRCFAGRSADEVAELAARYAAGPLRTRLRDDTVGRLHAHLDAGHRVVIVSASYADYLVPMAAELGVDAVLSSRLAVADGVCTGELDGANCRAAEKVRRLEAWLAEEGMARDDVELYAYGDSSGDRELLGWADHPTWIDDDPITSDFTG